MTKLHFKILIMLDASVYQKLYIISVCKKKQTLYLTFDVLGGSPTAPSVGRRDYEEEDETLEFY